MERKFDHGMFKNIRTSLGVTQETLAALLGMSRNMIWYYESGRQKIPTIVQLGMKYLLLIKQSK